MARARELDEKYKLLVALVDLSQDAFRIDIIINVCKTRVKYINNFERIQKTYRIHKCIRYCVFDQRRSFIERYTYLVVHRSVHSEFSF